MSRLTTPVSIESHLNFRLVRSMKRFVVVTCALGVMACGTPQNATQTAPESTKDAKATAPPAAATVSADMPRVDYAAIAAKLVEQCAGIKDGDIVQISGGIKDAELLEDIAVEVRKRGAFPLLTFGSDRLTRKMFDDVPARYDAQVNQLALKLAGLITARISVISSIA